MIKSLIKKILQIFGYKIIRQSIKGNIYYVEESYNLKSVSPEIVNSIFKFFAKVPPFYSNNITKELRISGAWRQDLELRRKKQIKYLLEKDLKSYSHLLDNMLRNELVYGLWDIEYYSHKIIGKKVPDKVIKNIEIFSLVTGLDIKILDDGNFGNKWGIKIDNKIITYSDTFKGVSAYNIANYLNAKNKKKLTYIDLGSGIGSDVIKVEKLIKSPTRILLIDIPLNLTTAFAYVSMNTGKKCVLIESEEDLEFYLKKDFTDNEFLFIPSIFVGKIAKTLDEIDLMFNSGSFSEMDYDTIRFYMDNLMRNGPVQALFEINSNKSFINTSEHNEVLSNSFPIPENFKLIKRNNSIDSEDRYIENLYVKNI